MTTKMKLFITTVFAMAVTIVMTVTSHASVIAIGLTQTQLDDLNMGSILDEIIALLPTVIPVVIGFIAFRKALGFVLSQIRGA
jgi:hypothetical protein